MSIQDGKVFSKDKASSCLSNLARDSKDKETCHKTQIGTISIGFPRQFGETLYGVQIGNVCQPTFIKKIGLKAIEGRLDSVTRTSHPNLLNLLDISVHESDAILYYEKPGIPLGQIRQIKTLDRIEVATICRKVQFLRFSSFIRNDD